MYYRLLIKAIMANNDIRNTNYYIAGSMSGLVEVLLTHPIDVIKTRIQQSSVTGGKFVLRDLKSPTLLYSGLISRLAGITPMRAMYWGTQDLSGKMLTEYIPEQNSRLIVSGMLGGISQTVVDAPIEYIKTQQIRNNKNSYSQIKFRGFTPTLYRNTLFATIFNCVANSDTLGINDRLNTIGCNKYISMLCRFGTAGAIASIISQPLDYYKTYTQTYDTMPLKDIRASIYREYRNNPFILWRGGIPRATLGFCTMSIGGFSYDLIMKILS